MNFKNGITDQSIYSMGLFQQLVFVNGDPLKYVQEYTMVKRVPGGWLIHQYDGENVVGGFVPYNEEFKQK
jgi:hypothetical protein